MTTAVGSPRASVTLALVAACYGGQSINLSAQRLALTVYGAGPPNTVVVYNLGTGQTESSRLGTLTGSVFTADGRYVLWNRAQGSMGGSSELYDTVTRIVVPLPFAFRAAAAHPRQLAVFGYTSGSVARLDLAGLHSFPACGADVALDLDVTIDGALLVVVCSTNPFLPNPSTRIVVLNAVTGQQLRVSDLGAGSLVSIASDHDASRVLVSKALSSNASEVSLVDTVADQVTPVFVDAPFPSGPSVGGCDVIGVSAAHDEASVRCQWTNFTTQVARTELIRLDTLQRRVLTAVPRASSMHFSPDMSTAIVVSYDPAVVQLLDIAADTVVAQVALTVGVEGVAYPPAAPEGLTGTVDSGRVSISWTLPPHSPAAVGYVLEAGTAPGLSNIGTVTLGPATSVAIPGVPPGRYYARVRATNYTGTGAASHEVVIDVP
jgi:hypothetical protein